MLIKVKSFASLRNVMDKEIDVEIAEGADVSRLLELLCRRYEGLHEQLFDRKGSLNDYVNILKNGRNVYFLDDLATRLDDGDVITIFPPIAGG
ncbi:ubiquitin-like small modifier protein 1 [Methanocella conradii]|uniref:ubiquitin-like small modifier protein 1 n=1 Tax=Methanocella conradii TaxID=1175444 RepID=UPI00157DB511|nr:ubiquitin-like small modifier protein 1 [Methanocella conradii]